MCLSAYILIAGIQMKSSIDIKSDQVRWAIVPTIPTGSESYTSRLAYLDSTAKTGTILLFLQIQDRERFRSVCEASKVIATSKTASVKVGIPEVDRFYASSMNV